MGTTLLTILIIVVPAIIMIIRRSGATDNIAPPSFLNNSDITQTDRLNKWLDKHPEAKKIYNSKELSKNLSENTTNEEIANNLLKMGAKVAIVSGSCLVLRCILVITEDMVLAFNGSLNKKEVYTAPNKEKVLERIKIEDVKEYSGYTVSAQKSVVKSAVVGGIIAGGAGAVVGAIAADNHNRNSPATKTVVESHKTGEKETWYYFMGMETRMPLKANFHKDICIRTASGITIDKDNVKKSISQVLDKVW